MARSSDYDSRADEALNSMRTPGGTPVLGLNETRQSAARPNLRVVLVVSFGVGVAVLLIVGVAFFASRWVG